MAEEVGFAESIYKTQLFYAQEYTEKLENQLNEQQIKIQKYEEQLKNRKSMKRKPGGIQIASNFIHHQSEAKVEGNGELSSKHVVLKITDILEDHTSSNLFYLKSSLIGKTYVVGTEGATIGSGEGCAINLVKETGVYEYHASIKHHHSNQDGASLDNFFLYLYPVKKFALVQEFENGLKDFERKKLKAGVSFQTGLIIWSVHALAPPLVITSSLYTAARTNNVKDFIADVEKYKLLVKSEGGITKIKDINILKDCSIVTDHFNRSCSNGRYSAGLNEQCLLHTAVKNLSYYIVQQLLRKGVNVDERYGESKVSALGLAIASNDIKMVKLLLNAGATIDTCDIDSSKSSVSTSYAIRKLLLSCMMLCTAAMGNDVDEVARLLKDDKYLPVAVKGFKDYTALYLACAYGYKEIVELLLSANNMNLNMICGESQGTCFHMAVMNDHIDIVKLLLDHGIDTAISDKYGYQGIDLVKSITMYNLLTKSEPTLCILSQCVDIASVTRMLDLATQDIEYSISPTVLQRKISTGRYGRKTSLNLIKQNAGLTPLVNQKNGRGLAPIHLAAAAGNVELIHLLVSYGANIELPGGLERWTPLFLAVVCGHKPAVTVLLMLGANKEYCFARGMKCQDHLQKLIRILKQYENSNVENEVEKELQSIKSMIPPQFLQSFSELRLNKDAINSNLKRYHEVMKSLSSGQEKLLNALKDEDVDELKRLLQEDEVNVNEILNKSLPITALNYTSSMGMGDMLKLLLMYNADPYIDDNQCYTPLHTAAYSGHENIVEILLSCNVDVNLKTRNDKQTALHLAARKGFKNIIELLLRYGADVSIKDLNGYKAFDLTTDELVQRMLASRDEQLYLAISQGDLELTQIFLETTEDINQHFRDGLTPLHLAVNKNYVGIARLLINRGADIDIQDDIEVGLGSPFHYACRGTSKEMVELLIHYNASLTVENSQGKTPFEVSSNNSIRYIITQYSKSKQQQQPMDEDGVHQSTVDNYDAKCGICSENDIDILLLPCRHQMCSKCVAKISLCPWDRISIQGTSPISIQGTSPISTS